MLNVLRVLQTWCMHMLLVFLPSFRAFCRIVCRMCPPGCWLFWAYGNLYDARLYRGGSIKLIQEGIISVSWMISACSSSWVCI